jgi:peptidoglycan hydrolase-like protein with peptidoglycan-binding domain
VNVIGAIMWKDVIWYHVQAGKDYQEGYISSEMLEQLRPVVLTEVSAAEILARFPLISSDPLNAQKQTGPLYSYSQEQLNQYKTIQKGDRGSEVVRIKRRLYDLGYYKNAENIDNPLYTTSTADIIKIFQRDVKVDDTGICDPYTLCLLFDDRTATKSSYTVSDDDGYLSNKRQSLYIMRAETASYDFYGTIQLSVKNQTDSKVSSFAIKVIPCHSDGTVCGFANSFAQEITKEYNIKNISIAPNYVYSDFETNETADWEYTWPHHFCVAYKEYFAGAQIAIAWYKTGGRTVHVDDDQLVWIPVGRGVDEILMHTLPIELTLEENNYAGGWNFGMVTHYVLPIYQQYYNLPQGAYVESVEAASIAEEAGLEPGDVIVGINNLTILGDATLRKARGRMQPGDIADLYFWRNGIFYKTEIIRPANLSNHQIDD